MEPKELVLRAWRDEEFCNSLSPEQRDALPERPANASSMTDEELEAAAGGTLTAVAAVGTIVGAGASVANTVRHWDD